MNNKYKLYGAILGDLAGQPYEFPVMKGPYTNVNMHNPDAHITDDTIMTLATAAAIIQDAKTNEDYSFAYKLYGRYYDGDYYGKGFKAWIKSPRNTINNSFGNGCLMRISPFMYMVETDKYNPLEEIFKATQESHNHVISYDSVYKLYLAYKNKYHKKIGDIKPFKKFKVRADDTLKFCLNLADQCDNVHEGIRIAIECGGDTDTNASIVGELLNYRYGGLTQEDIDYVESKLTKYQLSVLHAFNKLF